MPGSEETGLRENKGRRTKTTVIDPKALLRALKQYCTALVRRKARGKKAGLNCRSFTLHFVVTITLY